jgi:hypothetical protein
VIPCADAERRDIDRVTEKAKEISNARNLYSVRMQGLIATLLSENTEQDVTGRDPRVLSIHGKFKDIAKQIHCHILNEIATTENVALYQLIPTLWSSVRDEIQDKYALLLEKKVLKELNLDIGRCKDMWGARMLLNGAVSLRNDVKYKNKVSFFFLRKEKIKLLFYIANTSFF